MFTFETARLDGGGEFTRKEKLFKRLSLGDLPGADGCGARAAGKGAPCLARLEPGRSPGLGVGWNGESGGCHLFEPQLPSLYNELARFSELLQWAYSKSPF